MSKESGIIDEINKNALERCLREGGGEHWLTIDGMSVSGLGEFIRYYRTWLLAQDPIDLSGDVLCELRRLETSAQTKLDFLAESEIGLVQFLNETNISLEAGVSKSEHIAFVKYIESCDARLFEATHPDAVQALESLLEDEPDFSEFESYLSRASDYQIFKLDKVLAIRLEELATNMDFSNYEENTNAGVDSLNIATLQKALALTMKSMALLEARRGLSSPWLKKLERKLLYWVAQLKSMPYWVRGVRSFLRGLERFLKYIHRRTGL